MICKNCGTQILPGKFCAKCGTKISETPQPALTDNFCASCKALLKPGAKFCRACGTNYEPPPTLVPEEPDPINKKREPVTDSPPVLKSGNSGSGKFTAFIIIAAILLVIAAGVVIGYFFPRNPVGVDPVVDEPVVEEPARDSRYGEEPEILDYAGEYDPVSPPAPDPKQKTDIPMEQRQVSPKILPARLLVKTDPGNVHITLNGRQIGMTDDSGNLSYDGVTPGLHEVRAYAEGYDDATQNLQFTSGGQHEARLTLTRLNGNLSVKVNVGNADIRISGAGVLSDHNDQITALELPAGSYTVTVSKAGYRTVTGTADVQANGNRNISVTLEAIYSGPTSGVMVWEGDVRGPVMVTIEDGKASTGRVTGNPLPGVPCSIVLSDYKNAVIAYMPGRESDYKRVVLQVNSRGKVSVEMRWTVLQ